MVEDVEEDVYKKNIQHASNYELNKSVVSTVSFSIL